MRSARDAVRAVMMPSRYTADDQPRGRAGRWPAASACATTRSRSGRCSSAFEATLAGEFAGQPPDATEENIQARIRGTLLMALSNKFGSIVLTTGNKSEMAVGYATLYGDMAGGFAVLKDICKTLVYRLCALSQRARARDSRADHHPPAVGRTAARPDRPGLAAALRHARRDPRGLRRAGPQPRARSSRWATPPSTSAGSCG